MITLLTVSNFFPLKVVKKCQSCDLCVLRENSEALKLPFCDIRQIDAHYENHFQTNCVCFSFFLFIVFYFALKLNLVLLFANSTV